jgi:hypothetical protein
MLARCTAARLDRELAAGTSPEASARLAARVAADHHQVPPRIPLNRAGIIQLALPLARLAGQLATSGPVLVQGVARIGLLLADGMGPLYRDACGDDLDDIIG